MNRSLKNLLLFIFFCLISCDAIGPYRDIEITVQNVDFATVRIYNLDNTIHLIEYFDRNHSESLHFGYIKDGHLKIEVVAEMGKQIIKKDTLVNYQGKFKWSIEF